MGINPFSNMFKFSGYTKWYHYFWAMPLACIFLFIFFVLPFLVIGLPIRIADKLRSEFKRK
ncbi:hypothetical protein [Paenibacillus sp. LK1]|uniref:hypothetical protein n=1 Tax=Paenibacillus sp. LK1 TaxID=2053014 RepID=UPI000C1787FC|nr:hypothetical protein [Paenibacillus sp. LK1]PIH58258.1 hypothetical protein CS562_17460 [Paenibacillus sp. LK1]